MKDKILHLLNLKLGSRYQSLVNMLNAVPDAFEYIPEPTQEEANAFFKGAAKHGARVLEKPEILADIILKFSNTENERELYKIILVNPDVLNYIICINSCVAESLFIRTLYYKQSICEEINDLDETLLSHIVKPTYRMKFFSAKIEPISIGLIPYNDKSKRLYKLALELEPSVIAHISETTAEQRQYAINRDYRMLELIRQQTEEDCLLALGLSTKALEYVLPKNRTYHMTKTVLEQDHNLEWLNNGNFLACHWSNDELKLMVELGNKKLLGLLSLLIIAGTLEVSEETKTEIETKLKLKLELDENN